MPPYLSKGSTIIGILFGGLLADRLSRRWKGSRFYVAAVGVLCSAPFAYLTFQADSIDLVRWFSAGFGFFAPSLATNAFAAAYDVVRSRNRGMGGGVLNMVGGLSSSVMIYMAGIRKNQIGFPVMMMWMMIVAVICSVLLMAVVSKRFEVEGVREQPS